MPTNLLKNYCDISEKICNLKNKIIVTRDVTKYIISNTKSKKDKKRIYNEFEKKLEQIKNTKDYNNKYKHLKFKKDKLYEEILKIDKSINNEFECELNIINTFETTHSQIITMNIDKMISKYTQLLNNSTAF
jgi:hypothetical protein